LVIPARVLKQYDLKLNLGKSKIKSMEILKIIFWVLLSIVVFTHTLVMEFLYTIINKKVFLRLEKAIIDPSFEPE
jgi:hypothetical protein